jgi:cephalosporin hydroxylase
LKRLFTDVQSSDNTILEEIRYTLSRGPKLLKIIVAVKEHHKVLIVSELYYPEVTSTEYFVTGVAEGVARSRSETGKAVGHVSVSCSQPS